MALNRLANLHFREVEAGGQLGVVAAVEAHPEFSVRVKGWDVDEGAAEFGAQLLSGLVADDVVKGGFVGSHGFVLCVVDWC